MGMLAPGYQADSASLDGDLTLCATFSRGVPAYASPEWATLLSPEAAVRGTRPRGQL